MPGDERDSGLATANCPVRSTVVRPQVRSEVVIDPNALITSVGRQHQAIGAVRPVDVDRVEGVGRFYLARLTAASNSRLPVARKPAQRFDSSHHSLIFRDTR